MSEIRHINSISEITDIGTCNFIVSVLTSWQFDVAIAYIQLHHLANGILIIEAIPFSDSVKYRLQEEQVAVYADLFRNIYFCRSRKQPYNIKNLLRSLFARKKGAPLLWLRPRPDISLRLLSNVLIPFREVHYVALDEGLSSYMPSIDSYKQLYNSPFMAYRQWFIQKILNAIGRLFIKEKEEFGLFYSRRGTLVPNEEACKTLRNLYRARISPKENDKKYILFFKDYLVISDELALQLFEEILEVLKDGNYEIIIKKHPSDTLATFDEKVLSKYPNVRIINSSISGEEFVAAYRPELIIGGFSTVLISSYFIFKIPVISYSGIYVRQELVSSMQAQHIRLFAEQLGEYISFCHHIEDVCEKVKASI